MYIFCMQRPRREDGDEWVGLWDRENPRSVWSRVRSSMRKAMDAIPDETRFADPDILFKNYTPTETLQNARFAFWDLFGLHDTRSIVMGHVFNGARSSYYDMLRRPQLLMWFLTPPKDFAASQRSILDRTHQLVREALCAENLYITTTKKRVNKDGSEEIETVQQLNTKALAEARKLMDSMTDRVQGALVGRMAIAHRVESDPLSRLTSVEDILAVGNDRRQMLGPEAEVEYSPDCLWRPEPGSTKDESEDLSEFLEGDVDDA